jgi:hypothetical protein
MVEATFEDEAAQTLIRTLDKSDFPVPSALWLYIADGDEWRLIIATPIVESYGPSEGYRRFQRLAEGLLQGPQLLRSISLVSPSDALIVALGSVIRTELGINHIRFSKNSIDGTYIEDALIYRLIPTRRWGLLLQMRGGWDVGVNPPMPEELQAGIRKWLDKWVSVSAATWPMRGRPAFYDLYADFSLAPTRIKAAADDYLETWAPARGVTVKVLEPPPNRRPVA